MTYAPYISPVALEIELFFQLLITHNGQQDRESSPAKDRRSTTAPRRQPSAASRRDHPQRGLGLSGPSHEEAHTVFPNPR